MFQNRTPGPKHGYAAFGWCAVRDGPWSFENWPGVYVWCRALRIGLVYMCGVLAGESNPGGRAVCNEKMCFLGQSP